MLITAIAALIISAPPPAVQLSDYIVKRNPKAVRYSMELAVSLIAAANAHKIDWRALAAVAWVESRFTRTARGRSQEVGVMQVRTVDIGLDPAWERLRASGRTAQHPDKPWRRMSRIERARVLLDIPLSTYMGAWAISEAVRVCRRLGHRTAPYKGGRLMQLGRRYHRDWLHRWGHYNSGNRWPKPGYSRALRREYERIRKKIK